MLTVGRPVGHDPDVGGVRKAVRPKAVTIVEGEKSKANYLYGRDSHQEVPVTVANSADDDRRVSRALRDAGIPVSSVYDLVSTSRGYPAAIPVLLRFLSEDLDSNVKEGIVRALTTKEARGIAAKPLVAEFQRMRGSSALKWAIGNALEEVADDSVLEDLVSLAGEKRHGDSRQMLVVALGKFRDPRATSVLVELLDDEDVAGHAIIALGNLRRREARKRIEGFLQHPMPWIRSEAKRALAKIDTAARRRARRGREGP